MNPIKKLELRLLKPFKIDKNIKTALKRISKINEEILNKKMFPLTLGGEHSITPGLYTSIYKKI